MAGFTKIRELESKKRALVIESEICREAIKAELQNLRLYGSGVVHTFDRVRSVAPWLALVGSVVMPVLGLVLGKNTKGPHHASPLKKAIAAAVLGLQIYRKYGSLVRTLVTSFQAKQKPVGGAQAAAENT